MRYRRVMLLTEIGADTRTALAAVRSLAREPEHLVVACSRTASEPGSAGAGGPDPTGAWLERVRVAARRVAAGAEVGILPALDTEALEALVEASRIDLVVAGPRPSAAIPILGRLRKRCPVAVLWVPASAAVPGDRPFGRVLCVALGIRALRAVAAFLRDHGEPAVRVALFSLRRLPPDELASGVEVAGVRAPVELIRPGGEVPWRALEKAVRDSAVELVVLPRFAPPVIRAQRSAPVLVPPLPMTSRRPAQRPLDVGDPVDLGDAIHVRIGSAYGIGRNPPIPDQEVAFVSAGRVVATATTRDGEVELPSAAAAGALGVFRLGQRIVDEPVTAVERHVVVVRPGSRPLVLFDADLPAAELDALAAGRGVDLLAVRMRPVRACHLLRERLRKAGLEPRVVDASAVLGEGDASDVSGALDAVRLARVATRLIAAEYPVVAIVHRCRTSPSTSGFVVVRAEDVPRRAWRRTVVSRRPETLSERLDSITGAPRIPGNRIQVELDNRTARRWLLDVIARAERTLHLQTYMADDDDFGREVEAALGSAATRGVTVRVLADSLHGRHGSFGLRNPLLERISALRGVELPVCRPVAGLATLEDLKRRDHRKLVVADGRVALLGGRNIAHEYYRAFDEVEVAPTTPWREVPWLDAGARVEGPAVAVLERSFREAWTVAGGAPFGVPEPALVGPTVARAIVHHGLEDAAALEAYLAIIDTARTNVNVVTGFPLMLEIQHALLRALRRGVRVRVLFGHVAPKHGNEPFEGAWATARLAATSLVHSRMDALVAAGADCFMLAIQDVPGWAPGMSPVHPHVHAKALSADGRVCAVGSANMDLTGSYWESELLLLVEDEAVAGVFDERAGSLMTRSVRVERDDPDWQRVARRREWLRHWPGVLSP